MRSADTRLSRLEQNLTAQRTQIDNRNGRAYLAMTPTDRGRLEAYELRYEAAGGQLKDFTEDELHDFEMLVMPLAHEERADVVFT